MVMKPDMSWVERLVDVGDAWSIWRIIEEQRAHNQLRVVAAAVMTNGMIFSMPPPNRHHNILHLMHDMGIQDGPSWVSGQGFLLSNGQWADRQDAKTIAKESGQYKPRHDRYSDSLFSEDLW